MPQNLLLAREERRTCIRTERKSLEVETEELLRELAYVLHLTRRVRSEMEQDAR
jgi:hypothetical protein